MKQIPKIRFSQFDDKWSLTAIGNLAQIKRGASPRPIQDPKWFDKNSDIGWLRISDVTEQNGRIKYLEQKISKLGQEKTRVLSTPHLLLSIAATVGKPVVNYVKTGVHDGFLIFMNPKFDREFMFQWLEMYREKWNRYGQPGSQVNLNSDIVKNQKILIPCMEEQSAIGTLFRTLDDLLSSYKDNLANYQSLKVTMLFKMFPKAGQTVSEIRLDGFEGEWECLKMAEIFQIIDGDRGKSYPGENDFLSVGHTLFLDTGNVKKTGLDFSTTKFISEKKDKELRNGKLNLGDFILTSRGTLGNVAHYNENIQKRFSSVRINSAMLILRPLLGDKISPDYILAVLRGNLISDFMKVNQVGSAQPHITKKEFSKIKVLVPSNIREQQAIGAYFSNLDNLIAAHQDKISQLEILKKKLLQDMFI